MLSYPCSTYHFYTSPTQQCGFCTTCCDIIFAHPNVSSHWVHEHACPLAAWFTHLYTLCNWTCTILEHTHTHTHTHTHAHTHAHTYVHTQKKCNTYALMWQNIITLSGLIMKTSVSRIMFSVHLQVLNQTAQKPLFLFSICVPNWDWASALCIIACTVYSVVLFWNYTLLQNRSLALCISIVLHACFN